MPTIFQRMRAISPKVLLISVVFIILIYICMYFSEAYNNVPEWLQIVWYVLVFFAVYLALFSFVVIIVAGLKKLKGGRP